MIYINFPSLKVGADVKVLRYLQNNFYKKTHTKPPNYRVCYIKVNTVLYTGIRNYSLVQPL